MAIEQLIKKNPRITTYEQLTRPKTNRIDLEPIISNKVDESFKNITIKNNDNKVTVPKNQTLDVSDGSVSNRRMLSNDIKLQTRQEVQLRQEFQSQQQRRGPHNLSVTANSLEIKQAVTPATMAVYETASRESSQQISSSLPKQQRFPGAKTKKTTENKRKRGESYELSQTGEYLLKAFANSFQDIVPPGSNQLIQTQPTYHLKNNSFNFQQLSRAKY